MKTIRNDADGATVELTRRELRMIAVDLSGGDSCREYTTDDVVELADAMMNEWRASSDQAERVTAKT